MNRMLIAILIILSGIISPLYAQEKYDICVYGGTSAGVIAAYTATTMGKSVVLVVPDGHVGGLSTGGLGQTDIGKNQAIGGLSRDFYLRLGAMYGQAEMWKFEPNAALKVFSYYREQEAIPVIYNQYLTKVKKRTG